MNEYICVKCGVKSYSSADYKHLCDKTCLECKSDIKQTERDMSIKQQFDKD